MGVLLERKLQALERTIREIRELPRTIREIRELPQENDNEPIICRDACGLTREMSVTRGVQEVILPIKTPLKCGWVDTEMTSYHFPKRKFRWNGQHELSGNFKRVFEEVL